MDPNKRDLRAYVRYDGRGRIIPGSLVLRRNKPKNGHWKEIAGYACCGPNPNPFDTITTTVNTGGPGTTDNTTTGNTTTVMPSTTTTTTTAALRTANTTTTRRR